MNYISKIYLRAEAEGKSLRRRCIVRTAIVSTLSGWLLVGWLSRLGRRLCMLGRENMKRHLKEWGKGWHQKAGGGGGWRWIGEWGHGWALGRGWVYWKCTLQWTGPPRRPACERMSQAQTSPWTTPNDIWCKNIFPNVFKTFMVFWFNKCQTISHHPH